MEEDFADRAVWDMNLLARDKHVMPWRIEDELKALGANYVEAGAFGRALPCATATWLTGQQNFSGAETARLLIETLGR